MATYSIKDHNLSFDTSKLSNRNSTALIVIHHTAISNITVEEIHNKWKDGTLNNGTKTAGFPYHFMIGLDGTIHKGRPIEKIGAHCLGHNNNSIGISLEGDFSTELKPKSTQLDPLYALIKAVAGKYNIAIDASHIKYHKQLYNTECPGKNIYNIFTSIINGSSTTKNTIDGIEDSSSKETLEEIAKKREEIAQKGAKILAIARKKITDSIGYKKPICAEDNKKFVDEGSFIMDILKEALDITITDTEPSTQWKTWYSEQKTYDKTVAISELIPGDIVYYERVSSNDKESNEIANQEKDTTTDKTEEQIKESALSSAEGVATWSAIVVDINHHIYISKEKNKVIESEIGEYFSSRVLGYARPYGEILEQTKTQVDNQGCASKVVYLSISTPNPEGCHHKQIGYVGIDTRREPSSQTYCEPIYPDLITTMDEIPDYLLEKIMAAVDQEDLTQEESGIYSIDTATLKSKYNLDLDSLMGSYLKLKSRNLKIDPKTYKEIDETSPKTSEGLCVNLTDPFPVDLKIEELEQHLPRVVVDEINVNDGLNGFKNVGLAFLTSTEAIERRLVKLENNLSTVMRYLFRLGSRVNINCMYYGGQDPFGKYKTIRCLHDDRVEDGESMTLDQCLVCTRYEPILGQVYNILDDTGLSLALIQDDNLLAYNTPDEYLDLTRIERMAKQQDKSRVNNNMIKNTELTYTFKEQFKDYLPSTSNYDDQPKSTGSNDSSTNTSSNTTTITSNSDNKNTTNVTTNNAGTIKKYIINSSEGAIISSIKKQANIVIETIHSLITAMVNGINKYFITNVNSNSVDSIASYSDVWYADYSKAVSSVMSVYKSSLVNTVSIEELRNSAEAYMNILIQNDDEIIKAFEDFDSEKNVSSLLNKLIDIANKFNTSERNEYNGDTTLDLLVSSLIKAKTGKDFLPERTSSSTVKVSIPVSSNTNKEESTDKIKDSSETTAIAGDNKSSSNTTVESTTAPVESPFYVQDWKLTPVESQTPNISWRQSLIDDGSGLQANKLASSMTNPDNISNVGSLTDGEGINGYTSIEAGALKDYMVETYAKILAYSKGSGTVATAASSAIRSITAANVNTTLSNIQKGRYQFGANCGDITDIIIEVSNNKKVDPMLTMALIVDESGGVISRTQSGGGKGRGLIQLDPSSGHDFPSLWYSTNDAKVKAKLEIETCLNILQGMNSGNFKNNPAAYITAYNTGAGGAAKHFGGKSWEAGQAETSNSYFARICVAYNLLLKASGASKLISAQGTTGDYGYPVDKGKYIVTDTWRWRNSARFHSGIDIGTPIGTKVYAIADCIVTFAGEQGGYGNCIEIQLNSVLRSSIKYVMHGHLSKINVKKNQSVKRGEVIGLSGNTGTGSGPHLHFECRKSSLSTGHNNTVNPSVLYPSAANKNGKFN